MSSQDPDHPVTVDELEIIEFQSPGRFEIENTPSASNSPAPTHAAPFVLGSTAAAQAFGGIDDARSHGLAMIEQSRRSICIYTPDLEPWLYDHRAVQEACKRLLLAHPRNRVRILIDDPSRALRQGHRLITLARRLTSNLHIRRRHPDYPAPTSAFLIADTCGLLVRADPDQYTGHAHYQNPGRARQQQRLFDAAWDYSLSEPDLRSFVL